VTADDHLRLVARAARATDGELDAARRAARKAIGGGHPGHSLLHRLLRRLIDWLGQLVPGVPLGGSAAGLLVYAVLIAIAVGAVVVAIRALRRWRRAPAETAAPRPPLDPGFVEARAAALRLAATDPLEALRQLYASLLRELGRRRGWRPPPGRSNWSFVRRLGAGSGQGQALAECTRLFEGRVYGSLPAAEADVRRVDELAELVLS
jgi:hypothetical protein